MIPLIEERRQITTIADHGRRQPMLILTLNVPFFANHIRVNA
jgi:hypothetical protein